MQDEFFGGHGVWEKGLTGALVLQLLEDGLGEGMVGEFGGASLVNSSGDDGGEVLTRALGIRMVLP